MAKLTDQNRLSITHPELAAQWHPTKNGSLTPDMVSCGSGKEAWWSGCPVADDHEWEATVKNRSKGAGCPCCARQLVVPSNCLATTHPELAAQWHPTKNGPLTPYDIVAGSGKGFWWRCPVADDHEWLASPNNRKNGRDCPCCAGKVVVLSNCLAMTHPELAVQWHPTRNELLTPYDVTFGSGDNFWWKCPVADDHNWSASPNRRTNSGSDCPFCNESKGEKVIVSIISQKGYYFERQVRFDDCKYLRCLPFDFLVRLPNGEPFLVEYHGVQHYEPQRWGSSVSDEKLGIRFEDLQKRDQIKEQYAKDQGVPLLVIPYWDRDRIEVVIENFIFEFMGDIND